MDQTGRFPHQSARGNNYFFICYDYDANAILATPIKDRETETIIAAWEATHKRLTSNRHVTNKYILDKECSTLFKSTLQEENISY